LSPVKPDTSKEIKEAYKWAIRAIREVYPKTKIEIRTSHENRYVVIGWAIPGGKHAVSVLRQKEKETKPEEFRNNLLKIKEFYDREEKDNAS